MPLYNFLEYSDNYSKISGTLLQYYRDEPALNNNGTIVGFTDNNNTNVFKCKQIITGQGGEDGTKNVAIMIPLKYLSNSLRILEIPLINYEVNLISVWLA